MRECIRTKYRPKKAFFNLLRIHLGRSKPVEGSKAVLDMMSSALVELTAKSLPGKLLSCPLCHLLEVTPHLRPSADDFLPLLLKLHSGSPWLLFGEVDGTQTVTALILTLALAIPLGGRDGDQTQINYCPHLTFPPPPLAIVYRGRSALPCLSFLSLPPKLLAGNVFPIDDSHIQCLAFKL